MSLLNMLRNKQNPTATPAPAPVVEAPKADLQADVAKLEADERAIKAFAPLVVGECPKCKQEVTKENGSRTPSGRVVHTIGCSGASPILPPDAPDSTAPNSAQAILEGTPLSPIVAEAAKPFVNTAPIVDTRATLQTESTREPYTLPNGEPIAQPKKTRAKKTEATKDAPREDGEPLKRALFVNTHGLPDVLAIRANKIVNTIADQLCAKYGVRDLRFVSKDSPLAFGGWRGALAIAVAESDEFDQDGFFTLYTDNNEIMQVAADVLVQRFAVVIVGSR